MAIKKKFIIFGGGPSGLTMANALIDFGVKKSDLLLLEKENEVGGLCRSKLVDGSYLDIGGGHFLDVRRKKAIDFLFKWMPVEEWRLHERISRIRIHGLEIDHPFESNLWQLPLDLQIDYLESIAKAGCLQEKAIPMEFSKWIEWKLGKKIAENYMLPYNRKIWSMELEQLGTYWLCKLPNVSFRDTLKSCLENKAFGKLSAHGTFYYPIHHGYGEIWKRLGKELGESLLTSCPVEKIDLNSLTINNTWQADTIISTIPWTLWPQYCELPVTILKKINCLKHSSIDIEYFSDNINSRSHWIYEPKETISHHRLLLRSNFIQGARGHWTETNSKRFGNSSGISFHNEYSYPINTIGKPETVNEILKWAKEYGILGIGRWGKWEHMNSDVAVEESIDFAKALTKGYYQ